MDKVKYSYISSVNFVTNAPDLDGFFNQYSCCFEDKL